MLSNLLLVLLRVVQDGGDIYFEWPHRCQGWYIPELEILADGCKRFGKNVFFARVDGCMYGLRSLREPGSFMLKSWRIMTTDKGFDEAVGRTCNLLHRHIRIMHVDTTQSGFYPMEMAESIADFWL
jgi:hypothetical protein